MAIINVRGFLIEATGTDAQLAFAKRQWEKLEDHELAEIASLVDAPVERLVGNEDIYLDVDEALERAYDLILVLQMEYPNDWDLDRARHAVNRAKIMLSSHIEKETDK